MRCFIAIDLPQEVMKEVINIQQNLKSQDLFQGSYPKQESIHITLKFLGELNSEKVEKIKEILRKIHSKKFDATLGRAGIFDTKFPTVFWIGIISQKLHMLQQQIEESLKEIVSKEKRDYTGHITLAKIKRFSQRQKLLDYPNKIKIKNISFKILSFSLKESRLTSKGRIHSTLEQFTLN